MRTYRAVIQGNHIEWKDDAPACLGDRPVEVEVALVDGPTDAADPERGKKMAAVLEKIAARGRLAAIEDPVEWQREMRRDRRLPGRED